MPANPSTNSLLLPRRMFLRRCGLAAAALGLAPSLPRSFSAETAPQEHLPRSTPEEQGVSSTGLLAFLGAVAKSEYEFHSFMMARHGQVIAEGWWKPHAPDRNHVLFSLSKSFTSTAVGFAVTEGKLSVEDRVTSFFPDDLPADITPNLKALRVKHLLTMSVGHDEGSLPQLSKEKNWAKTFLAAPVVFEPGTFFLYNNSATYMLSAIVQRVTGQRLIDYLRPRLFDPLGIRGMTWSTCPRGINTGFSGLYLPTEGLLKFGQFYLQEGRWARRQLLPAAWIQEATSFKVQQLAHRPDLLVELKKTSDWHQGYCYQFWRCRHDAFRGDGMNGQLLIVMPKERAVVAITAHLNDMQGELNLVWDHILPAIHPSALPPDPPTHAQLQARLSSLALPPSPAASSH